MASWNGWVYAPADMTNQYRIETVGRQFIVVDPSDEIVGRYTIKEEAQKNIERCKKEEAMYKTAKLLVNTAVKTLIQLHGIDRETAERGIRDVMGGA